MKLRTKVEEKAIRLARETADRGEEEVGGNREVGDVGSVNFTSDSGVVAGRAGVLKNSATIGSEPHETEDCNVQVRGGGSEVVERQVSFVERENFSQMKGGGRGVTDSDDGGGVQSGGGDKVVVRGGRDLGRAERAGVDDSTLKFATTRFLLHFVR